MEQSYESHRGRRAMFGDAAADYDVGRPGYPPDVYALLRAKCHLGQGSRVLEIGPGTGQATGELLEHGASVTAVELSDELAAVLRGKYSGQDLDVRVCEFESAQLPLAFYDVVASATAFHWVKPDSGLRRCAEILRPGGALALWWNIYGDPARPDPFHDALTPILQRLAPSLLDVPSAWNAHGKALPYALDADARIAEIEAVGQFGPVHHEVITWTGHHHPEDLRALFASFSPWLSLPVDSRVAVLDAVQRLAEDEFEGFVERPYLTPVYLTHKVLDDAST